MGDDSGGCAHPGDRGNRGETPPADADEAPDLGKTADETELRQDGEGLAEQVEASHRRAEKGADNRGVEL
jgi:hypothetical protein